MYFKRKKRPHVEDVPEKHEGYRLEVWNGTSRITDSDFEGIFSDNEIEVTYSAALEKYPKFEILLFDVVMKSRRKYVPVSPEKAIKRDYAALHPMR